MTALDHTSFPAASATRAAALVKRVSNGVRTILRAWRNRHHAATLHELSDHQLADIGLTRADLVVAMHAPLHTDPTARLSSLARERYWTEFGARRVH
jgi:uncharacterized protein YjiS (DUF1127 family)